MNNHYRVVYLTPEYASCEMGKFILFLHSLLLFIVDLLKTNDDQLYTGGFLRQ